MRFRLTPRLLAAMLLIRPLSALGAQAGAHGATTSHTIACRGYSTLTPSGTVFPRAAQADTASFVDPTVHRAEPQRVRLGCRTYLAPFVAIDPHGASITIGHASNLQDNVTISGRIVIGDRVSIAHGATIVGPSTIGARDGLPAFVGFNAVVEGAIVEPDGMVTHLAKVSAGVTIRRGTKVLPGKWIRTQAEADNEALGKVVRVTDADRAFMAGVLHVNNSFAAGYTALAHTAPRELRGAGRDPGHSDFNHAADAPAFRGVAKPVPSMHVRVIGGVEVKDSWQHLEQQAGRDVSIRADEGEHFRFGAIGRLGDHVTFHALEHSNLEVGSAVRFGAHVVVHGGADDRPTDRDITRIGDRVVIGDHAVVFRSKIGAGVQIGAYAYVDGCHLAPGTIVPPRTIMIKDKVVGVVEW